MNSRFAIIITTAALILGACGGGENDSSDQSITESDASALSMKDLVTAIETLEYSCSPENFVLTSAQRQVCLTTSSVSLSPFVWDSVETFQIEVETEITCSVDSGLGELRSLRGDSWAISSYSLNGPTADYDSEIGGLLSSLQKQLGGDIATTICV